MRNLLHANRCVANLLNVQLKLLGTLTEEQKGQLTTIAGKCPIHKLMTEVSTEINTSYS